MSWDIDTFGNRMNQLAASGNLQPPQATPAYTFTQSATNRPDQLQGAFDNAGNLEVYGLNSYLYDGEGRVCAVQAAGNVGGTLTGYLYNAEGVRVAKGNLSSFSCDFTQNGFTPTAVYVLGPNNEQMSELDGSGNWRHTNVFAGGKLLATYDPNGTHFALADYLGTKRVQASAQGVLEESCSSLPYGDSLTCIQSHGADATEHHYTGKERDIESGLDYFGARYLASTMGRWLSPDPSGLTYANPYNPQSLNLYGYVLNNPLTNIDPTGKDCVYLNDPANGIDEVDSDSDTSPGDCDKTGGTHVEGHLTGYGSTDSDGTINEFYSNAYGTQNGSENGMPNPSTAQGFLDYLSAFLKGSGPTNVLYGPGNAATQQMQSTPNVQGTMNKYVQAGCPGKPGSPYPLQQGHAAAYADSAQNPTNGTQLEVGGYSGGVYTVSGTTTFTINNPSSMSSLDGESALNGTHSTDNPNGPTGAGHTVNQTFQWTEAGLCGH